MHVIYTSSPTVAVTLAANTAKLIPVPTGMTHPFVQVNTSGAVWLTNGPTTSTLASTANSTPSANIATLGSITGGSAYTAGTHTAVALTGGSGTGAQATITVSGGAVTAVTVTAGGTGYVVGDTLSAAASTIGGTGSGFSVPVATIGTTGLAYTQASQFLPVAGTYEFQVEDGHYLSLISTGTPTVVLAFAQ